VPVVHRIPAAGGSSLVPAGAQVLVSTETQGRHPEIKM
jgi:hypothetical protein